MAELKKRQKFVDWMKQLDRPKWTVTDIARYVGVSRESIHAFINGRPMRRKNKERLARLVFKTDGTHLSNLLDE